MSQTTYAVLRRDLRAGLADAATQAGPGGVGSVLFRAAAAVYALLIEHAVDRRGRCWRCRRPGSWVGVARRRCRVYPLVYDWLYQSHLTLAARLRRDLGLPVAPRGTPVARPGLSIIGRVTPPTSDHLDSPENGMIGLPQADFSTPVVSRAIPSPVTSSRVVLSRRDRRFSQPTAWPGWLPSPLVTPCSTPSTRAGSAATGASLPRGGDPSEHDERYLPPRPDALRLTREIDLCAAIRTVLHDPPPDTLTPMKEGGSA